MSTIQQQPPTLLSIFSYTLSPCGVRAWAASTILLYRNRIVSALMCACKDSRAQAIILPQNLILTLINYGQYKVCERIVDEQCQGGVRRDQYSSLDSNAGGRGGGCGLNFLLASSSPLTPDSCFVLSYLMTLVSRRMNVCFAECLAFFTRSLIPYVGVTIG